MGSFESFKSAIVALFVKVLQKADSAYVAVVQERDSYKAENASLKAENESLKQYLAEDEAQDQVKLDAFMAELEAGFNPAPSDPVEEPVNPTPVTDEFIEAVKDSEAVPTPLEVESSVEVGSEVETPTEVVEAAVEAVVEAVTDSWDETFEDEE